MSVTTAKRAEGGRYSAWGFTVKSRARGNPDRLVMDAVDARAQSTAARAQELA
jgi:hypothetical protein